MEDSHCFGTFTVLRLNSKLEQDPEGEYIRYADIEGYLSDIVRQPHAYSAVRAQRHHEAIAELVTIFGLPPLEAPIPRDSGKRVAQEEEEPTEVAPVSKKRGRPPKNKA